MTTEIDWPAAVAALDTGGLPCSSGERQILRLAASLAEGIPVDLRDALPRTRSSQHHPRVHGSPARLGQHRIHQLP
jgi:hypothetical protein